MIGEAAEDSTKKQRSSHTLLCGRASIASLATDTPLAGSSLGVGYLIRKGFYWHTMLTHRGPSLVLSATTSRGCQQRIMHLRISPINARSSNNSIAGSMSKKLRGDWWNYPYRMIASAINTYIATHNKPSIISGVSFFDIA